jgi:hypothetical protein
MLTYKDKIEQSVKPGGNFCGNGNATARQSEDDWLLIFVLFETQGQLPSCARAIPKTQCAVPGNLLEYFFDPKGGSAREKLTTK